MVGDWQIVAFPVILPWRDEFWTLPLYFPHLKVGVTPEWPAPLPYRGMDLPPEADGPILDLRHYQPGDVRQWQAYTEFRQSQGEEGDLLQAIRHYGKEPEPEAEREDHSQAWSLAWQLERMQAEQEAHLQLVDEGQDWLKDILAPEPWAEQSSFGPVPGVAEMVDPEMARLRYRLWRRVMTPYLRYAWTPLLLGRTARALFLTLRGWPEWTGLQKEVINLPGCRSQGEWQTVIGETEIPRLLPDFLALLTASLDATADQQELAPPAQKLREFIENEVAPRWPLSPMWRWDLEIWAPGGAEDGEGPVLCWRGAGNGILPGA